MDIQSGAVQAGAIMAIRDAIALMQPPSQVELARRAGISKSYISRMLKSGEVPVTTAIRLEIATGKKIKRKRFRPDIF